MLIYYCYSETFSTKGKRRTYDFFASPYGKKYAHFKGNLKKLMEEIDTIPHETVFIKSHDGLKLAARYYHIKDGAPLEIQFHGYRSTGRSDLCGGTKLALSKGHNVLMVEHRGHGISEGNSLTFGAKEKLDCIAWVNYAIERFGEDTKIFLLGVSMGAATVLLASGLPLPQNVIGVIADSPYTTAKEIIKKVCKDRKLPPKLAYPLVSVAAKLYAKCNLNDADVYDAVKKTEKPILLIHGEDDNFVPCEMSEKLLKVARDGRRVTFSGSGHVMSYVDHPEKYESVVNEFMEMCIKKAEATASSLRDKSL